MKPQAKLCRMPAETYEMLQTVYGDEALSHRCICEWFKRFKDGCRIFRIIQEVDVLQPLEMQTQSKCP
jgi:hypothetical protein